MPTLRSRRRHRTTETIRDSVLDLAIEHGLDNVTIDMIAERAGISPRSFFNYFSFKEEALLPPPVSLPQGAVDAFVTGQGSLLADLSALLEAHVNLARPQRARFRAISDMSCSNAKLMLIKGQTFSRYEEQICDLVARRLQVSTDAPLPKLIAAVVSAAIRCGLARWAAMSTGSAAHEVTRSLALLGGLFHDTPDTPRIRKL